MSHKSIQSVANDVFSELDTYFSKFRSASTGPPREHRSWHLGTGWQLGRWGRINAARSIEKNEGMICTPHKSGKDQFNIFLKLAVKGDKIFLHTKGMVTHVGEYTGDIRRGPPENGDEKLAKM